MNRILFAYPEVSPLFLNGGIGTFVFEVASLLAKSGRWEVDILTDTSYSPAVTPWRFNAVRSVFREAGIRLIDLDRTNPVLPGWGSADVTRAERYERHVARLHAERHYDIIEFPDWRAPGFFIVRQKRTTHAFADVRLLVHLHSSTRNVWEWQDGYFFDREDLYCNYMEDYVHKYSDAVLSPTQSLLEPIRTTQGLWLKSLYRNGYPISPADGLVSAPAVEKERLDAVTVACVSRLERRKGQDVLAQAVRLLSDSSRNSSRVKYLFCGRDSLGLDRDGWMSQSVRRILRGVDGWQILKQKHREELAAWLATEVDVCVVPSRGDNYPNVVMEAARAGCYVIASQVGGIPEIFKDYGIVGALVPPDDCEALAREIDKAVALVRGDPGTRLRIAEGFDVRRKQQEAQTLATYNRIVADARGLAPQVSVRTLQPRVSIVIPFYNAHQYAREAIESAFASVYPDFEVILVDDGSDEPEATDFLDRIAKEFPRLRVIRKPNGGLGDARNAGIKAASGELIAPLDADNMVLPDMLSACCKVLSERPHLAYVTTYFQCLRETDGARIPWQLSPVAKPLGAVDPLLLLENTAGDALAMIRRSALEKVQGYSTAVYCFEDWDLWVRFHEEGFEGEVLPQVHFIYRLRPESMSRSLDARTGVRLHQVLLRRHGSLVKEQSLAVSTLLLHEYWQRWRGNSQAGSDSEWDPLKDTIRRVMDDPALALRYVAGELGRRLKSRVRESRVGAR